MTRTLPLLIALLVGAAGCSSLPYGSSRSDRYPDSAKRSEGGQERYAVCHNGRSMTLPTAAVDAHLRHGDRIGDCRRSDDRRDRRDDRRDDRGRGRGRR